LPLGNAARKLQVGKLVIRVTLGRVHRRRWSLVRSEVGCGFSRPGLATAFAAQLGADSDDDWMLHADLRIEEFDDDYP